MNKTEDYIINFVNTVYNNYGELALSSFNEKTVLIDATNKINDLKKEIENLQFILYSIYEITKSLLDNSYKTFNKNDKVIIFSGKYKGNIGYIKENFNLSNDDLFESFYIKTDNNIDIIESINNIKKIKSNVYVNKEILKNILKFYEKDLNEK